jgi:TonB family protein
VAAASLVALAIVAVANRPRPASGDPLGEPVDVGRAEPIPVSPAGRPQGPPATDAPDSSPAASVVASVAAPPPKPAPSAPVRPAPVRPAPAPTLPPECDAPVADRYPGEGTCYDRAPALRTPSARNFPVPAGFTGARLYDTELWVEVLASGRVRGTIVSGKSGDALLDREAERRAKALRFRPALKGGRPVRTWYEIRMQPTR